MSMNADDALSRTAVEVHDYCLLQRVDAVRKLLGNVAEIQNFPTSHQDLSNERKECMYIPL